MSNEAYAAPVYSNLKLSPYSYDEELSVSPEAAAMVDAMPVADFSPTEQQIEQLAREYETNYAARASARWKGQERWQGRENEEMRLVNVLSPHQVFAKLQRAGVDARIETPADYVYVADAKTGALKPVRREISTGRFWLHEEVKGGRCGISGWVYDAKTGERTKRRIASLQYPYGPEWTIMYFDEFNCPTSERYHGWRTALLALLIDRVLTEEEVNRAFGPVVLNAASELYRQQLQFYRQKWMGLIQ